MMTRFANQELPEAIWGDNFLELSYGSTTSKKDTDNISEKGPSNTIRISFCALEALRTWALMDMGIERKEENEVEENSNNNASNKERKIATVIPHKSGKIPDPWDYTYTTNYSGSVECISHHKINAGDGFFDAKQPDRTTLYAIKVSTSQESSTSIQGMAVSNPIGRFSTPPTAVLRPPMCKCVGGRMICAGVAQTLAAKKSQAVTNSQFTKPQLFKSKTTPSPQAPMPLPKASPKWMSYCSDTDGPFDMEGLLNSQRSAPLHYTGTIPFWIQNLDPHSYSFLTATAMVCDSNNDKGGFIAVLLRCFVRVNGVRARLIDTKFVIRRQRPYEGNSSRAPMVILRERSWKEGSWEEYTAGMEGANDGNYHFLGTDLEQGKRASKNLPHRFPPIVEKLVIYDDDIIDGTFGNEEKNHDSSDQKLGSRGPMNLFVAEALANKQEERRMPLLKGKAVSKSAIGSGILVSVVDECTLVALDVLSGEILWEHNLAPLSVLSLAVQSDRHPSLSQDKIEIVVGDDRGCVHVINCNGVDKTTEDSKKIISKQSYFFEGSEEKNGGLMANVQRPSKWVEKVVWSPGGCYFAAAAGKKVMVNDKVIEMEGTIYDISFLPASKNIYSDIGDEVKQKQASTPERESLAIALYGGLAIVDAATQTIWHRRFTVGSSAVLSFAISPNGQSIGIGCHDKRLRVFEDAEALIANGSDGFGSNGIDSWDAHDWIGMDGSVSRVAFGPDNQRLAALGGSILLVIDRTSEWGEAPTICSLHQDFVKKSARSSKFNFFSWSTKDILVASTDRFLHMFDLRATIDTVPKRLFPFSSIPLDKHFLVSGTDGKIIEWGKSGVGKIDLLHC